MNTSQYIQGFADGLGPVGKIQGKAEFDPASRGSDDGHSSNDLTPELGDREFDPQAALSDLRKALGTADALVATCRSIVDNDVQDESDSALQAKLDIFETTLEKVDDVQMALVQLYAHSDAFQSWLTSSAGPAFAARFEPSAAVFLVNAFAEVSFAADTLRKLAKDTKRKMTLDDDTEDGYVAWMDDLFDDDDDCFLEEIDQQFKALYEGDDSDSIYGDKTKQTSKRPLGIAEKLEAALTALRQIDLMVS